jgi:Ca2+-binding EF-hand superfamily protein
MQAVASKYYEDKYIRADENGNGKVDYQEFDTIVMEDKAEYWAFDQLIREWMDITRGGEQDMTLELLDNYLASENFLEIYDIDPEAPETQELFDTRREDFRAADEDFDGAIDFETYVMAKVDSFTPPKSNEEVFRDITGNELATYFTLDRFRAWWNFEGY